MSDEPRLQWDYWTWSPSATWTGSKHQLDDVALADDLAVLKYVGKLGWELVAVRDRPNAVAAGVNQIAPGVVVLYFKRMLSAPGETEPSA